MNTYSIQYTEMSGVRPDNMPIALEHAAIADAPVGVPVAAPVVAPAPAPAPALVTAPAPAHVEIAAVGPYSSAALAMLHLLGLTAVRFSDAAGLFYLVGGHERAAMEARAAAPAAAPRLALACRQFSISNWVKIGNSAPGTISPEVADAMQVICRIFGMPCAVMEPDCAQLAGCCGAGSAPAGVPPAGGTHRRFVVPLDLNSGAVLGQIQTGANESRLRSSSMVQLFDAYSADALTGVMRDALQMLQIDFAYVWTTDGRSKFAVLALLDGFDACCGRLGLTYGAAPAALSPEERARAAARAAVVAPEKFVRVARTAAARFEDAVPVLLGSAVGTVAILRRDGLLGA